jgi:hypothetical protein
MSETIQDVIARKQKYERMWSNTAVWITPQEIRQLSALYDAVLTDPENAPSAEIIVEHESNDSCDRIIAVYVDRDGVLQLIEYQVGEKSFTRRRGPYVGAPTHIDGRKPMRLGEAQKIFDETELTHVVSKIPESQTFEAGVLVRGPITFSLPTQISVDDIMAHLYECADAEVFAFERPLLEYVRPALCELVDYIAVTYCKGDRKKARQAFLDSITPRMRWIAKLALPQQGRPPGNTTRRDEQLLSEYVRLKTDHPQLSDREFVRRYQRIEKKDKREEEKLIRAGVQWLRDARQRAADRAKNESRHRN